MKPVQKTLIFLGILVAATITSGLVFAYLAAAIKTRPLPTTSASPAPSVGETPPLASPATPPSIGIQPSPGSFSPAPSTSSPFASPQPSTSSSPSASPSSSPIASSNPGVAGKVEERIRGFFAERTGVTVQSVQCPAGIQTTAGSSFTCSTSAEGITFPVKVNITNAQGDFRIEVKGLMILARLEQQIQETVKQRTGVNAIVNCGSRLRITKAGENFQCQLTSPQGSQPVQVTVEDEQGRVRWKL